MLILTRKEGEVLLLTYQDIEIQIMLTDIRGGQAKIGIDAPRIVAVARKELVTRNVNARR